MQRESLAVVGLQTVALEAMIAQLPLKAVKFALVCSFE